MVKKIKFLILFFVLIMFSFLNIYKAMNANSNGGSGTFTCTDCSGSGVACPANSLCDTWKYPGIYVKLVYYDPDGKVDEGFDSVTHQKIIVGPTKAYPIGGKNYGSVPGDAISPFSGTNKNWLHTEFANSTRYVDFNSDQFEIDTVGSNKESIENKRKKFEEFLLKMGKIDSNWNNIKLENLTEESCETDKKGRCYGRAGYRLIAELYASISKNGGSGDTLIPVKSINDSNLNNVSEHSLDNESTYMSIKWPDINYRCNGKTDGKLCSDTSKSTNCLFDKNCGYGIWIVDISPIIKPNYDYKLDMACTNCESNTDKSMIIQDISDWNDIIESAVVNKKTCGNKYGNIQNYYKKYSSSGVSVFCRDEYYITYPNSKNNITIQSGRYFTVNETQVKLDKIDSGIPNFAPIEVERIRECKDTNNGSLLEEFNNKKINDFKSCAPGTITIKYEDKVYKYNDKLASTIVSFSSNIDGNSLFQRVKYSYRLKENVYRYVREKDGYSLKEKPSDLNENKVYKDLLVSNLPVSTDFKDNKVSFKYELPSSDDILCDTKIKKVYDNPEYLYCISNNIDYNAYKKESFDDLKNTACAKLYKTTDFNNSDFINCSNERKNSDYIGNCKELNNLSNKNDYLCNLNDKFIKCTKNNVGKVGIDYDFRNFEWDTEGKVCCEKGTKYASKSGKCCLSQNIVDGVCNSKSGDCNKNNYKELGRDWNENEGVCCSYKYKYNYQSKKCEPLEKCEKLGCSSSCCYDKDNNPYCGVLLNGKLICPGRSTLNNKVYRTIDLKFSFLNQNGDIRNTGNNWCSNRSADGVIKNSCSGRSSENNTVSTVITSKVIDDDHAMYRVHLSSSSIGEIRKYNNNHSYDDFEFECNNRGDECKSKFIRNSNLGIELTGRCSNIYFGNC